MTAPYWPLGDGEVLLAFLAGPVGGRTAFAPRPRGGWPYALRGARGGYVRLPDRLQTPAVVYYQWVSLP